MYFCMVEESIILIWNEENMFKDRTKELGENKGEWDARRMKKWIYKQ